MIMILIQELLMILIVQISVIETLGGKVERIGVVMLSSALLFACIILVAFFPELYQVVYVSGLAVAVFSPLLTIRRIKKSQSIFLSAFILGLISAVGSSIQWAFFAASSKIVNPAKIDLATNLALL